ncbi:MAG: tyrosine--tRNA ligase, partial [Pseudonocardiaceae bacterium]
IALAGGATGRIGDPSFRDEERSLLDEDTLAANLAGIRRDLGAVIDLSDPGRGVLVDNFEWTRDVSVLEFLRDVGRHFSVNAMINRESVKKRLTEREQGLSFAEFSYQLLQAFDFAHLYATEGCKLQGGGSDQWGNITAGIDLVRRTRHAEVFGFTWPLVTKADGTKFGKSQSGNVWLDPARTSPYQFFQFWVNTDDRDVGRYLRQFTFRSREEIEALEGTLAERPGEREPHRALARDVTALVHGEEEAAAAERASAALFGGDLRDLDEATLAEVFGDAPSSRVAASRLDRDGVALVDLLAESGLVASKSAARQAVTQGGVSVNGVREADLDRRLGRADLLAGRYLVLRRGKRNYHLVDAG